MAFYLSFALILSATWLNASQTYILSYRAQIKDAVVISESFHYAKSMQEIKAHPCEKILIDSPYETDPENIIRKNKEKIVDFLTRQGLHTRSYEKVSHLKSSSLITITIPPSYVTVDFNDDYAIITRLVLD